MIYGYAEQDGRLVGVTDGLPAAAVWLDLVAPDRGDEQMLESQLGLDLPTREDMEEIEQSSRLYAEDGALFMTIMFPAHSEGDTPVMAPVTLVLTERQLVTIRYHTPKAFEMFAQRSAKGGLPCDGADQVMLSLLDVMVDRLADVLERVGRDIEVISRSVFAKDGAKARKGTGWRSVLEEIGRKGDMVSVIRDSLGTLDRLTVFWGQRLRDEPDTKDLRARLKDLTSDVRGLEDHSAFMAQKISFLMDATLGLIGIEQNGIIKIFSVASVAFLPPTLIASIYGMNFEVMPELSWPYGYPMALGVMVLSAVVPYVYFRRRGWL
ncbi:magnesium and cobalt transport protein CorA [Pseudotabrizicola sediminis]|uniref:Magnesium transport protein CorA n=1 Tax=Pseudotabrizicola sediminis TaxID=2486418 RepID=A0ABY2KM80_9RHOB|nr:magnesium/cobalt transporter CorA [Pseudotabrizicola sediminis]TGD42116.1 magnesium and cobalt transport protein CorA [Pseudotabrizicola sediminis]